MKWIKAPEALKATIDLLMQPLDCQRKPMFGYPAYFMNGYLFAGLFQDKLFVRLSPEQLSTLRKAFPTVKSLEPMPGRPMKDYSVLPPKLYQDAGKMPKLLSEAAAWCSALPPKAAKPKRASPRTNKKE